jgi:CDP-6-deoxy-D-xylo-4-hexulose-3-dehydrase
MAPNNFTWPLINDNITQGDRKVLADFCLHGERFTNGAKVKEFEKIWSEWLGVKHSVMVNSGASANYISIAMVKELKGVGEVIVPPIGWVSDLASVAQLGMTPVIVDVSLNDFNITAENIKNAITPKTKAIVLVHTLGFPAINDEIIKLAKEHDLILIEDCCEAHGATYKDKKVGSFGDISLFSFYFGHHITTIEGGTVCVNDDKLYDLAKLFRSHGMTREASLELQTEYLHSHPDLNPLFTFAVAGFNMRSTELNAVLGLEQLQRLDYNIERRRDNLDIWLKHLDPSKFKTSFDVEGNSNFALPLIMQESYRNSLKINDDYSSVCDVLDLSSVEYRLGTAGGGNQARQPYLKNYPYRISGELKNADYIHDNALYRGNHTDLTKEQIIDLCKKLNNV